MSKKNIKKYIILSIINILFYNISVSQFKSHIKLEINDIKYNNGNLIIKYNINNSKSNDKIRIWIDVFDSKNDTIFAKTWKGDVNKSIEGGENKVVIWDIFNDEIEIVDSIKIKISATVENRFYLDNPFVLSTVYPGWGDYQIRQKKPYWIYGLVGYSLVGASVGMYYNSFSNYSNYLNSSTITDKNTYFDKAVMSKNLSYVFIAAAGAVWIADYIGLTKRTRQIKRNRLKNYQIKETPNNPSLKIASALSSKTFVNTRLTNLQVLENSEKYADLDENFNLDAFEKGFVEFELFNYGPAAAVDFYAQIESLDSIDNIELPNKVLINRIPVNSSRIVKIPIKANKDLLSDEVKFKISISADKNNPVKPFNIVVPTQKFKYRETVFESELNSDIDNPKALNNKQNNKYALIIGNEGYANEITGLSKNFNVPYARNDALVFKKYALNILGVKEENIIMILDGTKKEIYESILTLSDQIGKIKNKSELIFYYAGQGLSDTITNAPYIMPIDIPPEKLGDAISLEFLYKKIWESRSSKSLVIFDASFNNGGRIMGLRGPSAKKINPRKEVISGNTVVFNAVSEKYTANYYKEKRHGLFTYYFLKLLNETNGNIDYYKLSNSVKDNVTEKAKLEGMEQVPQANVSIAIRDTWQDWIIR
ncbi:MAG: caspase family protein [Bacteroidales bacterium]|nr:caspase family protein [Bacteroidales bacterium]